MLISFTTLEIMSQNADTDTPEGLLPLQLRDSAQFLKQLANGVYEGAALSDLMAIREALGQNHAALSAHPEPAQTSVSLGENEMFVQHVGCTDEDCALSKENVSEDELRTHVKRLVHESSDRMSEGAYEHLLKMLNDPATTFTREPNGIRIRGVKPSTALN